MGIYTRQIATVTGPLKYANAGLPNFVTVEPIKAYGAQAFKATLSVSIRPSQYPHAGITFRDARGEAYPFTGVLTKDSLGPGKYFLSSDRAQTAESLADAINADPYLGVNYEASLPLTTSNTNGTVIYIQAKGPGAALDLTMANATAAGATVLVFTRTAAGSNPDSILSGALSARVALEVYESPGVFPGQNLGPDTVEALGRRLVTLDKTYLTGSTWFNLGDLTESLAGYALPEPSGWFDAMTAQALRFKAKIEGFTFYVSDAFYSFTGIGLPSDNADLSEYVYTGSPIKLLTNQPKTRYVRGQRAYLNFIYSDQFRGFDLPGAGDFAILYAFYTQGGTFIGSTVGQSTSKRPLGIVNTCVLDLDTALLSFPEAAEARATLVYSGVPVSNSLDFDIVPECFGSVQDFAFLNSLGGWDCYNAMPADTEAPTLKLSGEAFTRTLSPGFRKGMPVEAVQNRRAAHTYTVDCSPMTREVEAWLVQLAESRAVIGPSGHFVIIEELTLGENPKIKYRLSENG